MNMTEETTTSDAPEETTAVTRIERPKAELTAQAGVLPILPTNVEEAQRYATGMIAAGIVPDAFKFSRKDAQERNVKQGDVNAPLVLMGVLKAMEIGVAPQTGLSGLLPLNGRFAVWGDLAVALVQSKGHLKNQTKAKVGPTIAPDLALGEWPDEYGWEVRMWRKGQDDPYIGRYTVGDARRAHLWMNTYKKPWIEHPDRMLFNRARAFALRDGFADALMGLSIAEEVLDSMPDVEEGRLVEQKRLSALTDDEPETTVEGE